MSYVGVNIGTLTVKVAVIRGDARSAKVLAHQGRPLEVLDELLASADFALAAYFAVSGYLGHIAEVAAIQRALREAAGELDTVVSPGGESFLVYILAHGRIANVLSHNKCAAGSGEFFVQQIGRMGLTMDEAISRSFGGKVVPLASRCSVHRKSDITHKLNRKEASPEDILRTLHDSMASKVAALLEKGQCELRRVLLIGGMTRNTAMLAALREKLSATQFVVLPESPWFEAWRSALRARDEPLYRSPKIMRQLPYRISEAILKPLSLQRGMPILSYESDGYAVSPSVLRQVDVRVQQVLDHAAEKRGPSPVASGGLAGIVTAAMGRLNYSWQSRG